MLGSDPFLPIHTLLERKIPTALAADHSSVARPRMYQIIERTMDGRTLTGEWLVEGNYKQRRIMFGFEGKERISGYDQNSALGFLRVLRLSLRESYLMESGCAIEGH